MCHYTHFSTEERELSRVLKAQGLSIWAIAKRRRVLIEMFYIFLSDAVKDHIYQTHIKASVQIKNFSKLYKRCHKYTCHKFLKLLHGRVIRQ